MLLNPGHDQVRISLPFNQLPKSGLDYAPATLPEGASSPLCVPLRHLVPLQFQVLRSLSFWFHLPPQMILRISIAARFNKRLLISYLSNLSGRPAASILARFRFFITAYPLGVSSFFRPIPLFPPVLGASFGSSTGFRDYPGVAVKGLAILRPQEQEVIGFGPGLLAPNAHRQNDI